MVQWQLMIMLKILTDIKTYIKRHDNREVDYFWQKNLHVDLVNIFNFIPKWSKITKSLGSGSGEILTYYLVYSTR